jgi:DNA polymerase-3 subunit alpha
LEIQNHGRPVGSAVLPEVIKVGNDTGVPLVATNTCLFAVSDDAQPYCLIRSIRSGQSEVEAHEAYASCFMKSPAEMGSVFADLAEAVENTSRIAARCNVDLVKPMSDPPIDMPAEFATADAYLSSLAKQGLSGRIDNPSRVYEERLDHELRIIRDMKVAAYFIFVLKYAQLAKDLGFLTCERGSSSASLVHYALGITTLDPIKWGLYFERFLNPERCWSSVPDLDLDIEGEGRLLVMEALEAELGRGRVAHVGRFSRFSEKKALQSVAEILGYSRQEIQGILYNAEVGEGVAPVDDRERLLYRSAELLVDTVEHIAIHPCGVVMSREDLRTVVPLRQTHDSARLATQVDMRSLDDIGLTKFDLIGSRNLSVLHAMMDLIAERHGCVIDLESIPFDDEAAFELLRQGLTAGVFMLGTRKMIETVQAFRPTDVEDVVALLALHHMRKVGDIASYARRKQGRETYDYLHPLLEPILKSTYGLVLYQEQIQRIGRDIGGLSLGEADRLRRAFRNSESTVLAEMRERFLPGAMAKGLDSATAESVFDFALDRSPTTFCKPHAVSYGRLAYQCAFLKAHYPTEFFCAFFNANSEQRWSIESLLSEGEAMGVGIDPPDINRALRECTIQDGRIRLGFALLKQCPAPMVDAIVRERETSGPFNDIFDVARRLHGDTFSRRILLSLISSGALDALPGTMAQKFAIADEAMRVFAEDRPASDAPLPERIDSFDLLREIASVHRHEVRDLSFDIYCPKSYSHHFRFTMWLPPDSVIFDVDISKLIEQARLFAGYLESEKNGDYAIGLNSRVNQYAEKHLLMLDLDSIDDAAIQRLGEYGGYLLKSGRGYHFIGKALISTREAWEGALRELGEVSELKPHIDESHIDMSLKRGYSTLRILESPAKPQRPMMIRMV